jgi:hypothetical protein
MLMMCVCVRQDYKVQFERTLSHIEQERERMTQEEEHWTTSWNMSVQRVKDLYKRDV